MHAGTYLYRPSSSLPNTAIISVLGLQQTVLHVRAEYREGLFHVGQHQTSSFDALLQRLTSNSVTLTTGEVVPCLTQSFDLHQQVGALPKDIELLRNIQGERSSTLKQ
jgi:hypothetical protein